jgi:hypothetical protein
MADIDPRTKVKADGPPESGGSGSDGKGQSSGSRGTKSSSSAHQVGGTRSGSGGAGQMSKRQSSEAA